MLPPLILALLNDPGCYDHPVDKIELVETHISWVLLTGRYAYKIRKPVNMGFLDFSTLELRHADCLEELRLNRRLAADYYLDVVAITGSPENPRVNGFPHLNPLPQAGGGANESLREIDDILEYAVKMRQFPADATLDRLASRGELGNAQIDALAQRLAQFHLADCASAPQDSVWGEPDEISKPVAENFQLLYSQQDKTEQLTRLRNWCVAEHERLTPLMAERKKKGWVRECHGDLHLANLAWVDDQLVIFDCLEFSARLRWIDVISEVAFCYMDLLHRNLSPLATRFINAWLEVTGDYQGVALLRYYAVYRALVRAKVAVLRADRCEMNECLQLAEQIAFLRPSSATIITHGYSGSGKTTISQQWLEKFGMIRLRSDVERKRLALSNPPEGIGRYSEEFSRKTYQYLALLAEELLKASWPVIVDAAFLEREQRDQFRDLAQRLTVDFHILDIQAPDEVLRQRVSLRKAAGTDASEADLRVLEHQLKTALPLAADEVREVINPSEYQPRVCAAGFSLTTKV